MNLTLIPYRLQFKFPFRIAHGARTGTDAVFVKLQHKAFTAWGEATLPPYLPETQQSVMAFLEGFAAGVKSDRPQDWLQALQTTTTGNMAAHAALDMALWSLIAQTEGKTLSEKLGVTASPFPLGTYTIGVCSFSEMQAKVAEATKYGFRLFKIKLDGAGDEEMINNFRQLSALPFAVDINQGWNSVEEAVRKIEWLKQQGCILVEQPLAKGAWAEMRELRKLSTLPVYADEACQRLGDLELVKDCFDGINIKLMKCGGLTEALQIIKRARDLNLKVLVGCMSESSVGCTAAAALTPLADYADLDGPYLIANDPFCGMKIEAGRISIANNLHQIADSSIFKS